MKTEELFAKVAAADLSEVTLRVYQDRIRVWEKDTGKTMFWIMSHPGTYIPFLREGRGASSVQTLKGYVSVILAIYRHNPVLKEKHKKHVEQWYAVFAETHKAIEDKYSNNTASEKQLKSYVPFADIIAKRDSLAVGSMDRLILAMYSYIPPLRADFNHLPVYVGAAAEGKETENFIRLDAKTLKGKLVLREFKTKKKLVQIENELPEGLVREILANLKENPREFLFCDRSGAPYTAHGYMQYINRVLKRLFERPLTISMLRHSFINSLDFNTVTVKEREEIARMMAHSVGMQDRYRLLFRTKEGEEYNCRCGPSHTSVPRSE